MRIRRQLEARTVGAQGALVRGREAAERLAWADAYAALVSADRSTPLAAEDLELLATAAYLLGHVEHCLGALQRAHQLYAEGGDHRRAAWCAGWLGFHLSSRGDLAQASGWFGRASRLLEHARQEGIEHGYLLTSVAFQQLMAGEYADARATAERAAAIGGRAGDADLVAFGLYLQGRALVWDGRVGEGLALLDEAMVAVVAGELSPVVAGTVYCGTIEICQAIAELRRAQEWTEALTTWWGRQPDMVTFTGQCLVHRAEILQLHGAWPEAVEEAKRAGERVAHAADDYATGAACHQQAELYRLSGDFSAAEDAYGQASRWVTSPSRAGAAAAGPGQDRRGRGGDLPGGGRDEPAVQADEAAARAGRDHAGGRRPPGGTRCRRRADRDRQRLRHASSAGDGRPCSGCGAIDRRRPPGCAGCPACRVAGAQAVFARLGARPDLARVEALAGSEVALSAHGLTRRELQVLRLLATGKTNQAIATDLVLAEKTVHRHVSNIFTKLNVSSRAAATAYADQHHLL